MITLTIIKFKRLFIFLFFSLISICSKSQIVDHLSIEPGFGFGNQKWRYNFHEHLARSSQNSTRWNDMGEYFFLRFAVEKKVNTLLNVGLKLGVEQRKYNVFFMTRRDFTLDGPAFSNYLTLVFYNKFHLSRKERKPYLITAYKLNRRRGKHNFGVSRTTEPIISLSGNSSEHFLIGNRLNKNVHSISLGFGQELTERFFYELSFSKSVKNLHANNDVIIKEYYVGLTLGFHLFTFKKVKEA